MTFIVELSKQAIKHERAYGVLPSLIIAQGILESSSGTSELAKNANNLFGIKKGVGWNGEIYKKKTGEYDTAGKYFEIVADFRKYQTFEGAVIDLCNKYANGLPGEKINRYSAVLSEKDYKRAAQAVYAAGYATDPNYPTKLISIIEKNDLTKYDKEVIQMAAVVLSSGHGKYVSGANSILNEVTEARKVVNRTAEILKKALTVHTFHDDISKKQGDNIDTIVKYHDNKVRDGDYSVHFNASAYTKNGVGVEVLYYSDKNKAHAAALSKAISDASGLKDRGAKKRTDLGFLSGVDEPAWLIEICFVDSEADAKIYKDKFEEVCQAIAKTIAEYNGKSIDKKENSKVENIALTPGQQKAIDKLVAHGMLAKGFKFPDDPTGQATLTLCTILAPLLNKLETKGSI